MLLIDFLYAEDPPEVYAAYGFVPGLGQFLLGNEITGSLQLGLFLGFLGSSISMTNRPDYIQPDQRKIDFKLEDAIIADYLEKNNLLYKDYPFLSESQYDRIYRMIQYKKLIEINPLLEYGSYERMTYATAGNELLAQSAQHVLFYSVYSSYRDAGGIKPPSMNQETYLDLVIAPFQPKYIFNRYFWIPMGILLALTGYETSHPPKNPQWTLLYPGMKRSGFMNFYITTISFNAGVSEEAFFRGFLNHFLVKEMGLEIGIASSSLIFGLAHLGNGLGNVLFATLGGLYFGYIHYKENWDIRQGIAVHFWWDVIVFASNLRYMKEDKNVLKNQKEIHFMPIYYQFKF
jgi:membrane protease YdiL (CAAX protease family)